MSDIFSYINLYGALTFNKMSFNKIDALIFSKLSYLDLNNIVPKSKGYSVTIAKAYELFRRSRVKRRVIWKNDPEFFKTLAHCERFKSLRLSCFTNEVIREQTKQFCALTIEIENGLRVISYRGTDHSVTGWEEDFSLYSKDTLPSQQRALEYFTSAKNNGEFILTGHSKGGNLALYTAENCESYLKDRIKAVYNFDGPSLNKKLCTENCHVFVPSASVFGLMLNNEKAYYVIKSRKAGLFQHDLSNWEISGSDFIYLKRRSLFGRYTEKAFSVFIKSLSESEKPEFIKALFKIFYETGMDNFDDILKHPLSIISSFISLEKGEKDIIVHTIFKAIKSALFPTLLILSIKTKKRRLKSEPAL